MTCSLPAPFPVIVLIGLLKCVHSQDLVSISFTNNPVLATSGAPADFSIVTVSDIFSTQWVAPNGGAIGTWTSAGAAINGDYQGRVSLTATRLQFNSAELRDAGNYSVTVAPSDTTGLRPNTASVEMRVFTAVAGVSLSQVPSVAVEGRNLSLRCSWSAGTQVSVAWGKGDTALTSGDRVVISGGSLVINPANRGDTGEYSCTVSNPVSVQTTRISLTVYYGPDAPTLTKDSADCVGGGDAVLGQAFQMTCTSASLPPATFTWQHNNEAISSSQSSTGTLSLQVSSTDASGRYVCAAQNSITGGSSQQETQVSVVSTCLSGGAVAGIVIACFVAIVIIIAVIIVLLRQRNTDRRLRHAIRLQKPSQDPVNHPPPDNVRAESAPDPPLHNLNSRRPTYSQPNGTNTLLHNGVNNSNANNTVQRNGHLGNGTLHRNGNTATNGIGNGYSGHQNNSSFPNAGQQNPNVVIQTGQTQPGALQPTVHVNLNTLPMADQQNANTQPQTVNVNLNTYPPPSPARQELNTSSGPEANTLPQNNLNTLARHNLNSHRDSLIQTDHSHVNPAFQPDVTEARQLPPYSHAPQRSSRNDPHGYNAFAEAHQSRPTDMTYAGHRSASRQPSTDDNLRQSTHAQTRSRTRDNDYHSDQNDARDSVEVTARHQQRPWDTLRGTPAYPNHQAHRSRWSSSSSSSNSSDDSPSSAHQPQPSRTAPSSGRTVQAPRPAGMEARTREREAQRANTRRAQDSPAFMDPNAQRRRGQEGPSGSQPRVSRQQEQTQTRQAAFQSQSTAAHANPSHMASTTAAHANPSHMASTSAAHANPSHMASTTARSAAPQMQTVPQHTAAQPQSSPQNRQPPPYGAQVRQVDRTPQTRPHAAAQSGPEQRRSAPQATGAQAPVQTGQNQNSSLTQAALQHHSRHTHNPFTNRNQQTEAALQNPGPQARQQPRTLATQPPPAPQKADGTSARRPPTPPPVLQPHQFQNLPKERTQQQQQHQHTRPAAGPFPGAMPAGHRQTAHLPPEHRPPGGTHRPVWHVPTHGHPQAHRHPANAPAHRHTADAHLHANQQRHAIAHRPPPAHVRQVHRSRPR